MNDTLTAVAASRSAMCPEFCGCSGWWYKVTVEGARGGHYEVAVVHVDGRRPLPYGVKRSGHTTRSMGTRATVRRAVEAAALQAIL